MAIFDINKRVSLKGNPSKKGTINEIHPFQKGYQFYDVIWDDGSLETVVELDLTQEVLLKTPWDLFANNNFTDSRNFSIASTVLKVKNTTTNTISTLKASRTIFKPYQFKPLLKFLRSDSKRIIVADEVGLGKTIEAGHIILEQAARNSLKNALIICTKSLLIKWQTELKEKFNFHFKIYETTIDLINDLKIDIETSKKSILGIINYEKCRNDQLQSLIKESSYTFDLLICDEAHKIRNSETEQHKGVTTVVDKSSAVVFLTATPIMTELRNLFNLIKVLDPQRFDSYDIFQNAINQNKPFIRALSQIGTNADLNQIANELHNSTIIQEVTADEEVFFSKRYTVAELFENDHLYQRLHQRMIKGASTLPERVQIQQDLLEMNSLNHIYTRTRKKDVQSGQDAVVRIPHTLFIKLTVEEKAVLNEVFDMYEDQGILGLMQKKRQISSCIAAYLESKEDLERGRYNYKNKDSKFDLFISIVEEVVLRKKKKLIVFAFFTKTLLYLKIKLEELNIGCEIIHGVITDRTERIESFKNDSNKNILLSSEVGSEGLDLQFCDALVNYDLPWNPMVVEQRIGRIDRVGQLSKVIHIYNLVLKGTIEEKIFDRLFERIQLFRQSLGDLEDILGENEKAHELIKYGIEKLYTTKLTEEQQNKILETIESAIVSERLTLDKIKIGLQEAFANDFHFQSEIESIEKNRRYLSKEEIISFLESIIRTELTYFQLVHIDKNLSELRAPKNGMEKLFDLIEKNKDNHLENPELENIYRKFKARFYEERIIPITFDQEYAFNTKNVEFISAFHPLINAITNHYQNIGLDKNQAFKIAIKREHLEHTDITCGFFVLAQYRLNINKKHGDGRQTNLYIIKNALADLNGDKVSTLCDNAADKLCAAIEKYGSPLLTPLEFNTAAVKEIRSTISSKIITEQNKIKEDEQLKFISSIQRQTEQEATYLGKRIERMKQMLLEKRGIEKIIKSDIKKYTEKLQQVTASRDLASIEVSHTLISVNLIEIV